jgi:colanic acid biosynthesis acetyltransferase WcaB
MTKDSVSSLVRSDIEANRGNLKGMLVLVGFRLAHWCNEWREKFLLLWLIFVPYLVLYRLFVEWILGVEIPQRTRIGSGIRIFHGCGIVINDHTVIGNNVTLRHSTTLGNNGADVTACPVIGNSVDIGCHVVILGPVRVGDNAIIAAGAVVLDDVAAGSTVGGVPAKVIKEGRTE